MKYKCKCGFKADVILFMIEGECLLCGNKYGLTEYLLDENKRLMKKIEKLKKKLSNAHSFSSPKYHVKL